MKRIICALICAVMLCSVLAGCAAENAENKVDTKDGRLEIVVTTFPIYDWLRELTDGTDTDVRMLIDSGVDLHSFQPTVNDIVKIADCDLFVYIGGESDDWVHDALKEKANAEETSISLMEALADIVKEEELVEGMEAEEEEEEEEDEPESDEHIWLSLKNAEAVCEYLSDRLCGLDPDNAEKYKENKNSYLAQLDELDKKYEQAVENAKVRTLVFADRFPFRYMVDDYGLSYYAAFAGCSAETEASFETVVFLSGKIDELGLNCIMKIESSDGAIAETVRENTSSGNQRIITLDSLQSTTMNDVENGLTYMSAMQDNLTALKEALAN